MPTYETVCWAGQRFDAVIPEDCGGLRCQDSLLKPSEAWAEGASLLPTTCSQVGAVDPE